MKQWDQQNENQHKKATSQAQKRKEEKEKHKTDQEEEEPAYRDRAQERRLDANPDYDPQFKIAETLDAEQSQFLGGDLQHTHLVKGLDYALLRKIRQEEEEEEEAATGAKYQGESSGAPGMFLETARTSTSSSMGSGVLGDVRTSTALGASIKQLLRAASLQKSQGGGARGSSCSQMGAVLQRTAFEFNVDILCDDELPTTGERCCALLCCEMDSPLTALYCIVLCCDGCAVLCVVAQCSAVRSWRRT